jgi:hypothetical protein
VYGSAKKAGDPADICCVVKKTEIDQKKKAEEVEPWDNPLMVYVTCPNDEVAKATATKMIKHKVCS